MIKKYIKTKMTLVGKKILNLAGWKTLDCATNSATGEWTGLHFSNSESYREEYIRGYRLKRP